MDAHIVYPSTIRINIEADDGKVKHNGCLIRSISLANKYNTHKNTKH